MSYRILIADDEAKIIQLIRQLGHWEELGIEVAGTADDGLEAYNRILELRPDIVLTDIRMPTLDGLQLIEKVKAAGVDARFVVISGYRYFEYARAAISLGVVDYLLKPLDEDQLNLTLERACCRIDEQRRQTTQNAELQDYQEADRKEKQEKFWEIVFQVTAERPEFADRESIRQNFQIDFREDSFLCVHFSTSIDELLDESGVLFSSKFEESCAAVFAENCFYLKTSGADGIYLLLNFDSAWEGQAKRAVSALFYRVKDLSELYGDFMLNVGISSVKTQTKLLGEACEEARIAEWGRLVLFGNRVLEYSLVQNLPRFYVRDIWSDEQETQLNNAVLVFDFETVGKIFGDLEKQAVIYKNAYPGDMMHFVEYLTDRIITHHHEKWEGQTQTARRELLTAERNARNFPQLIQEYYKCFNRQLHQMKDLIEQRMGRAVQKAISYMELHYAEPLSLEDVAAYCGLTSSYFSRLFKAEQKTGFVEYLTNIRMSAARGLLTDSGISIREIAARVGYPDDKYFMKTFKKHVGISPKEFRRLYAE